MTKTTNKGWEERLEGMKKQQLHPYSSDPVQAMERSRVFGYNQALDDLKPFIQAERILILY